VGADQDNGQDEDFAAYVAAGLASLPGVRAVALGGSRVTGNARPDSDWDFSLYYRGSAEPFDPETLRTLGWPGDVFPLGGWGGGVFNSGAWLRAGGRQVDVHYRDLDDVERRIAEAAAGRFGIESLMFHLAGIPTYLVVGELAVNRVLSGTLPRPEYPAPLREAASRRWAGMAQQTLAYARKAHAARGHLSETAGSIATAGAQAAHGMLAARGEWVSNEKRLLDRAGLRELDGIVAGLTAAPGRLRDAVDAAAALLTAAVPG
jgi:hypothetical protein